MGAISAFQNVDELSNASFSQETEARLYQAMYRIRHAEESLAELYKEKEMRTPTHFGIGQEAIAVGVCEALNPDDVAYSHHRCHTHYLAKGGSLLGLIAELYGRTAGCSRGRGGSVHLTDRAAGFIGSSPILGQSVALATGSALAFRMDAAPRIAVAFFGEAVCEEGVVYEAVNYASVNRLPVLYVCENNFYSTESPLSTRQAPGTELCERMKSFKVDARKIDGNDVVAVLQAASQAIERVRSGGGPFFLECETYRWREHVGPLYDHELNRTYRTNEEVERWKQRCPVLRMEKRLLRRRPATAAQIEKWKADVHSEFSTTVERAKSSPWPDPSSLFDNVY